MDDFLLEQVFPMSWFEMGAENKESWDLNGGSLGISMNNEGAAGSPTPHRSFAVPVNASGTSNGTMDVSCQASELQETIRQFQGDCVVHYPLEDTSGGSRLPQQCSQKALDAETDLSGGEPRLQKPTDIHESFRPSTSQGMPAEDAIGLQFCLASPSVADSTAATFRALSLPRLPSEVSNGNDRPDLLQSSPSSLLSPQSTAAWQQSYLHGKLPTSLDVARGKAEGFPVCKGIPDDQMCQEKKRGGGNATGRSLSSLPDGDDVVGAQVGPSEKAILEAAQQCHKQFVSQGDHGSIVPSYGTRTGVAQTQGAAAGIFSVTTRPRQRARRGQATDPHSIAERLRRERIAERMKALQELVPNSNKTDKASMLDEIVDYVKFLQLQVKVLSMSRLGGAGTVAPLLADLPAEGPENFTAAALGWNVSSCSSTQDTMALIERQVARLIEDDMGSAMRFLQERGLCLMPVSLATTISATNSRSTGSFTVGNRSQVDAASNSKIAECCSDSALPSLGILPDPNNGGGDGAAFDSGSKPNS